MKNLKSTYASVLVLAGTAALGFLLINGNIGNLTSMVPRQQLSAFSAGAPDMQSTTTGGAPTSNDTATTTSVDTNPSSSGNPAPNIDPSQFPTPDFADIWVNTDHGSTTLPYMSSATLTWKSNTTDYSDIICSPNNTTTPLCAPSTYAQIQYDNDNIQLPTVGCANWTNGIFRKSDGQLVVGPFISNQTFILGCSSAKAKKSVNYTTTINVTSTDPNPIKVNLQVNGSHDPVVLPSENYTGPSFQDPGIPVTLTWTSNYSDLQCRLYGGSNQNFPNPASASGQVTATAHQFDTDSSNFMCGYHTGFCITCIGRGEKTYDMVPVSITAPPPKVWQAHITGNDQSGTITVPSGTNVLLKWDAANYGPADCNASGDWTGRKDPPSGQEFTGPLYSNKSFTITCKFATEVYEATQHKSSDTLTVYVSDSAQTSQSDTTTAPCVVPNDGKLHLPCPAPTPTPAPTPSPEVTDWSCFFTGCSKPAPAPTPTPPVISVCNDTARAVVNAAGGCGNIDPNTYKNIYASCCMVITKTTILQMLDTALADGVLDSTEKLSLLGALNQYLSN